MTSVCSFLLYKIKSLPIVSLHDCTALSRYRLGAIFKYAYSKLRNTHSNHVMTIDIEYKTATRALCPLEATSVATLLDRPVPKPRDVSQEQL